MERNIEIRMRHWVYVDQVKFFGTGRYELLQRIAETGSISQAAKDMGLSYKKAWAMVDAMNTLGKNPYVVTQKGGSKGGGTVVTDTGKKVLEAYKKLTDKLLAVVAAEKELLEVV
jgi:molybdate transport system regulatory protein